MSGRERLTEARWRALIRIDRSGEFSEEDEKLLPGLHFCEDWDFLPICDDSPEIEACSCNFGRRALKGDVG